MPAEQIANFVHGQWQRASGCEYQQVVNPATSEVVAEVPLSSNSVAAEAVESAAAAFPEWRRTLRRTAFSRYLS